jgi:hypothetical protein
MPQTRRRTLMQLAGASLLPLTLRTTVGSSESHVTLQRTQWLQSLVRDSQLTLLIGRAYRAQYPAESTTETLTQLLWRDLGLSRTDACPVDAAGAAGGPTMLDARVRSEFGAGQTVLIGGWVLARTEARLCALRA